MNRVWLGVEKGGDCFVRKGKQPIKGQRINVHVKFEM